MAADPNDVVYADALRAVDVPLVAAMERRNYDFPWAEGIFLDCVKAGYVCQALRQADTLIGYGILQIGADEAHILNLCIDAPYQRRGHARSLLNRLVEIAASRGVHTVFLEVRPSNPRAVELYEQSGFNEIGMRKGYYDAVGGREDALVMARSLVDGYH